MKLKEKNPLKLKLAAPRVKLTDSEILADLTYPAPQVGADDDRSRGLERSASH
ncbi:MAG: hypothetical protein M9938_02320 [Solirubrobacterales bacterium]|nr:hypothetical protein [Solirubrobacterales bacterium]